MQHFKQRRAPRRWLNRSNLPLLGFLAIAGVLLLTEHRAHTIAALPWVLLALCLVLHFFGHGGHGRGGHD